MKRNGLKKMFLGVAAGAMMLTSMAMGASAAVTDWKKATVTVNMYIPKAYNPVMSLWDAYFTNPVIPPNSSVSNNATVEIDGSKAYLIIPLKNTGFSLYASNDLTFSGMTVATEKCVTTDNGCSTVDADGTVHAGERYTTLVYDITDCTQATYDGTLTNIKSHAKANVSVIGIVIKSNDSVQTTPVKVEMDLSAAKNTQTD